MNVTEDISQLEQWKDIPGYDGKYQASTEGNIRKVYQSGKKKVMSVYPKKSTGEKVLYVKLTKDRKEKLFIVSHLIARTFIGERPPGTVIRHKNGLRSENRVNNLEYIDRNELGKMTGAMSARKPVVKIGPDGNDVEYYGSARKAAKANYISRQSITDRCNGKVKNGPAPDGYEYAWDDSEWSRKWAVKRIKESKSD